MAQFDAMGRLTFHVTSQAPHVYRTAVSLGTGIPEDKIHVISPDIGGGFGNKVPVYPGYVCAIVGALQLGRPVKWIESRTENLTSTGFARDYHMDVELGAKADGTVTALKVSTTADHGAFDAAADPTSYPAGCSASSPAATPFRRRTPRSTPTSPTRPGGRLSLLVRVTEASYAIERAMDILADELKMDPVSCGGRTSSAPTVPLSSALGFTYDSGDYDKTLQVALEKIATRTC